MTTFFTARQQFVHLSALIEEPAHWRAVADNNGNSDERTVAEFTASLRLLVGVPFKYLVPNNTMLPPESIRFFYVDPNWIEALVDGAMSLGRIGKTDVVHDQALSPVIARRAEAIALNRRRVQLKQPAAVVEPVEEPVFGGFLLRSALVSGWPGLEVQAFKSSEGTGVNSRCTGDKVDLVRMERLSTDVLICLFAEQFGCVNIHEPKEGINFGANPILPPGNTNINAVEPEKYTKQLRGLGIGGYPIADFIQGAVVDVPLRTQPSRVVSVDALRLAMVAKLTSLQPPAWTAPAAEFTSAQFSLQMIEGASQAVFRAENTIEVPRSATKRIAAGDQRASDREKLNAFLFAPAAEENA